MYKIFEESLRENYLTRRSATFPPEMISDDWLDMEPEIAELILEVPKLLDCVETLVRGQIPEDAKIYYGNVYAYVFNPYDLYPEEEFGYYGYFDDFIVLLKALKRYPDLSRGLSYHCSVIDALEERFARIAPSLNPRYLGRIEKYLLALEKISDTIMEMGVYSKD